MARAHLYKPIVTTAGDIVAPVNVRVLNPGGVELLTDETGEPAVIYSGPAGDATYTNGPPSYMTFTDGIIDFYLDRPRRVRLGVSPSGQNEFFLDDVDVMSDSVLSSPAPLRITNVPTGVGQVLTGTSSATAEFQDPPASGGGGDGGGDAETAVQVTFNVTSPPELTTSMSQPVPLTLYAEQPADQDQATVDGEGAITINGGVWAFDFTVSLFPGSTPAGCYLQSQDGAQGWVASFTDNGGIFNAARSGVLMASGPLVFKLGFLGDHSQIAAAAVQLIKIAPAVLTGGGGGGGDVGEAPVDEVIYGSYPDTLVPGVETPGSSTGTFIAPPSGWVKITLHIPWATLDTTGYLMAGFKVTDPDDEPYIVLADSFAAISKSESGSLAVPLTSTRMLQVTPGVEYTVQDYYQYGGGDSVEGGASLMRAPFIFIEKC